MAALLCAVALVTGAWQVRVAVVRNVPVLIVEAGDAQPGRVVAVSRKAPPDWLSVGSPSVSRRERTDGAMVSVPVPGNDRPLIEHVVSWGGAGT